MHQYKNGFSVNPKSRTVFTCHCRLIEYLGYEIHKYCALERHIVKDGVCVGMRGSVTSAKAKVDELIIDQLRVNTNDKTLLGMAIMQAITKPDCKPPDVIAWVQSQAKDNPPIMEDVIGKSLTQILIK